MFWKGIIAGLAISAPVGPVNVLCISRTISRGSKAGIISGLGAATVDTFYGAIAGFSIQFVIRFLLREEFWIRLVGGVLLISIGLLYYFRAPQQLKDLKRDEDTQSDYVSALLLNFTNPTVVLSFMAVLTALGLPQQNALLEDVTLVAGIFAGSMLWWILLAAIARRFRGRLTDRGMRWMNRIAGVAIGGFGLVSMLLAYR